ncbi:hypothetical protein HYH03_012574 [Edaphochlamys debaryana]|uniref:Uncharacterized protein n=1 Tax=Edaphochlamys debaryana TaxID=47281 RepID=A0A835XSN4_9CHLO|nr:hypothetical protein HYH03_012574 [Edaphochlamys debaryana]|eukprot:KAG2488955.1 hypothetical protein HYH03_012574 [Edaphochlamys debaryana]
MWSVMCSGSGSLDQGISSIADSGLPAGLDCLSQLPLQYMIVEKPLTSAISSASACSATFTGPIHAAHQASPAVARAPAAVAEEAEESDTVRVTLPAAPLHGISLEQRTPGGPVTIAAVFPSGAAAKSAWVKPGCELVRCSRALNVAGCFEAVDFECAGQELGEVLSALASNARCGLEGLTLVLREAL